MIILYHANCNDGSASALAAWLKLGDKNNQYIAVFHGQPPPPQVVNQDVLIVDFCYPREVLLGMKAKSITILDHHVSAQKDLAEPFAPSDNIKVHFDLTRSGAVLTWQHFFPNQPIPRLFELIEDRDLWSHKYPESTDLNYALSSYSEDFRQLQPLLQDAKQLQQAIQNGRAIHNFIQSQTSIIVESRHYKQIGEFKVPVVNAPSFMISDLVNQLLLLEPDAPFAAGYSDNLSHGMRSYSLRSDDKRQDVSVIAKQFGGGGHRNAAGFTIDMPANCHYASYLKTKTS